MVDRSRFVASDFIIAGCMTVVLWAATFGANNACTTNFCAPGDNCPPDCSGPETAMWIGFGALFVLLMVRFVFGRSISPWLSGVILVALGFFAVIAIANSY